jgi:hypothetical protein
MGVRRVQVHHVAANWFKLILNLDIVLNYCYVQWAQVHHVAVNWFKFFQKKREKYAENTLNRLSCARIVLTNIYLKQIF